MFDNEITFLPFDLTAFAEGGGDGAAASTGAGGAGAADAQPSATDGAAQETEAPVADEKQAAAKRKADFEKLIKGEYKQEFDSRTQSIIDQRFKNVKELEGKAKTADQLSPVLEILASKYGVDGSDVDALVKAIQADDSYYEQEAMEKGLSVEQLKHVKQLERENAEFKRTAQAEAERNAQQQIYAKWMNEAEECKQTYQNFDLQSELSAESGQRFLGLLRSGVDVKTAYQVIHQDEILGGAMQYAVETATQKTVNDIRARGMRPTENGGQSAPATIESVNQKIMTKEGRAELARRAMRGERIVL